MVEGDPVSARQVVESLAYKDLKSKGLKYEVRILSPDKAHLADILCFMPQRVVLLEIWKAFEENYSTAEDVVKA